MTFSSAGEFIIAETTLSYGNVTDAVPDPQMLRYDMQARAEGDETTAEILIVGCGEAETSTLSDLPDGL